MTRVTSGSRPRCSVKFEPSEAGTQVRLTQTGFDDESTRDEFAANWPGVFDEVARRVERG